MAKVISLSILAPYFRKARHLLRLLDSLRNYRELQSMREHIPPAQSPYSPRSVPTGIHGLSFSVLNGKRCR